MRRALADTIRDVCINVGFLYSASPRAARRRPPLSPALLAVKNHGVPEETITRAYEASKEFFFLPDEKKAALDITKNPGFKGYNALLASNNDPASAGDMHEGFEFGWEALDPDTDDEKRASDGVMAGANVWPADLPQFREAALTY